MTPTLASGAARAKCDQKGSKARVGLRLAEQPASGLVARTETSCLEGDSPGAEVEAVVVRSVIAFDVADHSLVDGAGEELELGTGDADAAEEGAGEQPGSLQLGQLTVLRECRQGCGFLPRQSGSAQQANLHQIVGDLVHVVGRAQSI